MQPWRQTKWQKPDKARQLAFNFYNGKCKKQAIVLQHRLGKFVDIILRYIFQFACSTSKFRYDELLY